MATVALVLAVTATLVVRAGRSGREPQLTVTSTDDVERRADQTVSEFPLERLATIETAVTAVGRGPLLPDAPNLTIVAADFNSRLQTVDVASGEVRAAKVFAEPSRARPRAMQVLGDGLILDTAGDIVRIADDDPVPVVLASGRSSIPTNDSTSVWVFDGIENWTTGVASRVDFDGKAHDRVALPALVRPLVGTGDSLIVATPTAVSRIFDNATQHEEVAHGRGLVSDGTRLARLDCAVNLSCSIVIGTLDDPNQVRVPLEPEDRPSDLFEAPRGRFSPDGHWLALSVYRVERSQIADDPFVMIIDVTLGAVARRVPGSTLTESSPPIAWSPDNRWLAISTGTGLRMWSAERNTVTELDIRLSPIYALAIR